MFEGGFPGIIKILAKEPSLYTRLSNDKRWRYVIRNSSVPHYKIHKIPFGICKK